MSKIIIAGAGGAPSEGVIKSLLKTYNNDQIIGIGSEPADLNLSSAHKKYYIPYANTSTYKEKLLSILKNEKPDFIHFQHDLEIYHASLFKEEIEDTGTKTFLPPHEIIDTCVHKFKSYQKFKAAGLQVPESLMINDEADLELAFKKLTKKDSTIWLRASTIGGGGKGALPTDYFDMAKAWITRNKGWGEFMAAEMLTNQSVTWQSIWYEGELIVAQSRLRKGWVHSDRAPSGVTGVTKISETISDPIVDEVAVKAIHAVMPRPHGIFGVDMTYDKKSVPNPTEINIARFFTTILFFTEAGLNMPGIMRDLLIDKKLPSTTKKINPLPEGLLWLRGMDALPIMVSKNDLMKNIL